MKMGEFQVGVGIDDPGDRRLLTEVLYRGGELVFVNLIRANA